MYRVCIDMLEECVDWIDGWTGVSIPIGSTLKDLGRVFGVFLHIDGMAIAWNTQSSGIV